MTRGTVKYPFDSIAIGESFLIPLSRMAPQTAATYIYARARQLKRKFRMEYIEGKGCRITRVMRESRPKTRRRRKRNW